MIIPDAVAENFADSFAFGLANDIATKLNCGETDDLAALLTVIGRPDLSTYWIQVHARADDSGDLHYQQ
jgi:hypothetical protein